MMFFIEEDIEVIKVKKGFLLRKLGEESIVVAIGEASKEFNGMIRLNETGVFYWEKLEKGTTEDELVRETIERFDGIDKETARQDVRDFLNTISIAIGYDE